LQTQSETAGEEAGVRQPDRQALSPFLRTGPLYLAAILLALGIATLIIALLGGSPGAVARGMIRGSFGSSRALGLTLDGTATRLTIALGSIVAFRAGLINIGQEGQVILGAIAATAVSLHVAGPGPLVLLLAVVVAAIAGGVWAGVGSVLLYERRIHETLSTLLLTFLSYNILSFALNRQYLLQMGGRAGTGNLAAQSDRLPESTWFPSLEGLIGIDVQSGLLIALAMVAVVIALDRSDLGFRVRLLAHNPVTARANGVSARRIGGGALIFSGAMIGVAGALITNGSLHRLQDGFTNNIGWEGLLIAQAAQKRPLVVIPVALVWSALHTGGGFLVTTGLSRDLVDVVKGLLVIALLLPPAYEVLRGRKALSEL